MIYFYMYKFDKYIKYIHECNIKYVIYVLGKMVTFSGQDCYAEETPLMFSRCSSLGSLSGFEQHSIHDDRSSVVSDFR